MNKKFIQIAAWLGALSVAAGAFGAHGLKQILSDKGLATFETAVRYQFYHVFALLAVGILQQYVQHRFLTIAGNLFIAGIVLFSGSLYVLTYLQAIQSTNFMAVGIITPFGGLCFIAGWILLALSLSKQK